MKSSAFPGLEVTMTVAGQALPEYENQDTLTDDQTDLVRYVEATPGANFAVTLSISPCFVWRDYDLNVDLDIDGTYSRSSLFDEIQHGEFVIDGVAYNDDNGNSMLRRFQFAALHTVEDRSEIDVAQAKQLAQVKVSLYRVKIAGAMSCTSEAPLDKAVAVSEKALKGRSISTRTVLDSAVPRRPLTFKDVTYPYGTLPFLEFTFKYRSHKDLQIEGIIPRSPSPVPLEQRDLNSLTNEELREVISLERKRAISAQSVHPKQEPRVKRERKEEPLDAGGNESDGGVQFMSESNRSSKRARTKRQAINSAAAAIDLTDA